MKIGIAGLGLMGGSMLKSLKKRTSHKCYGFNRTKEVLEKAKPYLDGVLTEQNLKDMDILFICMSPSAAANYARQKAPFLGKGQIICDICGVKEYVVKVMESIITPSGAHFVGCHPMAGKEVSGFDNADARLFEGASFIITPTQNTPLEAVEKVSQLALEMGFAQAVKAAPQEHDQIIAYTSQLAHIVSNAYAKSPTLKKRAGFSAGSFEDLTRVARLDSKMWTELFLLNKDNLLTEIDLLIRNLKEYGKALKELDKATLTELLEVGNKKKLEDLFRNGQ